MDTELIHTSINCKDIIFEGTIVSLNDDDVSRIILGSIISDMGMYSTVYNVIYKGEKMALKHIYDKNGEEFGFNTFSPENIEKEICIMNFISDKGMSPKLHGYYRTEMGYMILMDKIEGMSGEETVQMYACKDEYVGIVHTLLKGLEISLTLNRVYGIHHGDFHLGNFIVDGNNVYIIDFGISEKYQNEQFVKNVLTKDLGPYRSMMYEYIFSDYSRIFNLSSVEVEAKSIDNINDVIMKNGLDQVDFWANMYRDYMEKDSKIISIEEVVSLVRELFI
jgi:serine/threonine protein kinase